VLLAPVMFVLGAVLIFSLALGELLKPAFGSPITMAGLLPPTLLTALFVALAVLHLKKLSFRPSAASSTEPGRSSESSVQDPPAEMATGSDRQQPAQPGKAGASPGSSTRLAERPFRE
jgi:predicted lipid-binding transport protein (Tim44 family)